jgi:hypothetical protein
MTCFNKVNEYSVSGSEISHCFVIFGVSISTEVRRFFVISWAWVVKVGPFLSSESHCLIESSRSIPFVMRQKVFSVACQAIFLSISEWAWRFFDVLESLALHV